MAKVQRITGLTGTRYRITGSPADVQRTKKQLEAADVANARAAAEREAANARFRADMGETYDNLMHDLRRDAAAGMKTSAALMGGTVVGTAALTAGMIRSRRFRCIAQAVLHFLFACTVFFIATFATLVQAAGPVSDDEAGGVVVKAFGLGLIAALVGGSLWTFAYVKLRTPRKLRRLDLYSQSQMMPGYGPQRYYPDQTYPPQQY